MIGMFVQPRNASMTNSPSMPGRPEIQQHDIGVFSRGRLHRSLSGVGL